MLEESQQLHDHFRTLMLTVVGQAYQAAGYSLLNIPTQNIAGKYRWRKIFDEGTSTFIDYQLLAYNDNAYVAGNPSRFRVTLTKPQISRTLSQLVVSDFGVAILPSPDYWWIFHDTESLGKALAEAGHLVVGYAIPWLSNDLIPPQT